MEKEARHLQWATLRLAGKPLISGSACGVTPLLWVACRASFGLLHIYCDSELKTKDKIILSVCGGQIVSISLKALRDRRLELHFEAPTLLLGCLLREALIWRLKNCEAIDNFQYGKNKLDRSCMVQDGADSNVDTKVLETKKQIEVLLDRAEGLSTNWNEIKLEDARETKVFPIIEDIQSIMNDLLKIYRSFRQS